MLLIALSLLVTQIASPAEATKPLRGAAPGRELDARAAAIALRLATAGRERCPVPAWQSGLVFQHLSQFTLPDRPGMVAALALDQGPAVIAVVPDGPAEYAGVRVGDVLLAIDGTALPGEPGLDEPFDPIRARRRDDAVHDLLGKSGTRTLTLLRDGAETTIRLHAASACPSQVHLARSEQRNAYADGRHVLLTTGLVARLGNEDELAFVIAHEMAHNILGHAAVMRGGAVKSGMARTLGRSGAIVRAAETAADALGGTLMLDAGYDPVRGATALRQVSGVDPGMGFFTSHASTGERIAAMRALVAARALR